ncbi:phage baseplate assembly protein V [Prodigiosinella aquatilis]|nr:phage baseplate assembly protein V [Prodigiosinella sp. LS101]WJV54477.1 phage baseplate assembly protein V [Prodigiosinella sp. LS101]WJV58839.1 phage baseplate assembly protein V [Pectobacteriaceae bacterium C111]
MNAETTEIMRLLLNLIRVGVVIDVDSDNWLCRVQTGELQTGWLNWLTTRAGTSRTWWKPSPGEQVLLLSIGGELTTAFVLPAIFSSENPPPSVSDDALVTVFPDGARFEYEPASGQLLIDGVKSVVLNANTLTLNAAVTINGPVIQQGGAMSSNGVVVHTHQHRGVQTGGSNTGGPV